MASSLRASSLEPKLDPALLFTCNGATVQDGRRTARLLRPEEALPEGRHRGGAVQGKDQVSEEVKSIGS